MVAPRRPTSLLPGTVRLVLRHFLLVFPVAARLGYVARAVRRPVCKIAHVGVQRCDQNVQGRLARPCPPKVCDDRVRALVNGTVHDRPFAGFSSAALSVRSSLAPGAFCLCLAILVLQWHRAIFPCRITTALSPRCTIVAVAVAVAGFVDQKDAVP